MKELIIEVGSIKKAETTEYDGTIIMTLEYPDMSFLKDICIEDIILNVDKDVLREALNRHNESIKKG